MFFVIEDTDIACYADDNTPYVIADDIAGVIKSLAETSKILCKWFNDNLMRINAGKYHLLVSTNNTVKTRIGNVDITNSKSEKLLGIKFDHKLSFDDHIFELCKIPSRKFHALSRVASFMNISKDVFLWMRSLNHNLAIVPLYGCVIVVLPMAI